MASAASPLVPIELPKTPVPVEDFIRHLESCPEVPVSDTLEPFKTFESVLRKVYAQQPDHEDVKGGLTNLVNLFSGPELLSALKIRARPLSEETAEEAGKYIMPLTEVDRKPNGSPAIVTSFKEFQSNFNLFSEASLVDMDFSNIVVAGSAVTTALLPVPEKWAGTKRSLREYYHQHLAPASDVDIFIYGLNEDQAIEKIKNIELCVKDSILSETTTIRTRNAITIASQYPTRHVQIVLRLYDSISQIITGFDVDCACVAYTGDQVFAAPRAIAAFVTQVNTIDLTRRSPSYENRLSKYSHRGFEVHWPLLDRSRVDPTIFERSFGRIQGLARLLVLEKLPKKEERDAYVDQRRMERGRPALDSYTRAQRNSGGGNIKDREEDDVAEWVVEEDVSSYHTFTIPYGEKYHARKIERILYAKDLLLNSEWNRPDERDVDLHRHGCFFGSAEEVIEDCCGHCPVPITEEEQDIAAEESKIYISGRITFLKDDPGRQSIGSFNPVTTDDWTEMAFVGNTARLCQAIVEGDIEHVQDWCSQEGVDVNRRDFCGRTPLHLATSVSTPEIVQCLVDHGARLVARLFDGKTALHLAAARGSVPMIEILMAKSIANEEEEEDRIEAKRASRKAAAAGSVGVHVAENSDEEDMEDLDDSETIGSEDSITQGDFVKLRIDNADSLTNENAVDDENVDDPDIYDVDVLAWDYPTSPFHLAIINGHLEAMQCLVQDFGADHLLPISLKNGWKKSSSGVLLTLALAMSLLPVEKAKKVFQLLIELGVTASQADPSHFTGLQCVVLKEDKYSTDFLDLLLTLDAPVCRNIVDLISADPEKQLWYGSNSNSFETPCVTAIQASKAKAASRLLSFGANPSIEFEQYVKAWLREPDVRFGGNTASPEANMKRFKTTITQPLLLAVTYEMPALMQQLLELGANPSTLTTTAEQVIQNPSHASYQNGESTLDLVRAKIKELREYIKKIEAMMTPPEPEELKNIVEYLSKSAPGTYEYFTFENDYQAQKLRNDEAWRTKMYHWRNSQNSMSETGAKEKGEEIARLIQQFVVIETRLIDAGAKPFKEMYPELAGPERQNFPPYVVPPPQPWEPRFSFSVPDLNEQKRAAYILLFEAVYRNDVHAVKEMTLGFWGTEKLERPLEVAVRDANGFSPFSLAASSGFLRLAEVIIDIALAQYQPEGKRVDKYRWNLLPDGDCESDDDSDEINICRELVDENFTIDVIGAVSDTVQSSHHPLEIIEWECNPFRGTEVTEVKHRDYKASLLKFAVISDDIALLKFLLRIRADQISNFAAMSNESPVIFDANGDLFQTAIAFGRTSMLAEFIKAAGVGIPLNELVQKSGIEAAEKPKYYQGLSVGGKKRKDWALAAGGRHEEVFKAQHPPLLVAAHVGNVDSVEWFLSPAPARCYAEWVAANKNDPRVEVLQQCEKGCEGTIAEWLNTRKDLTLHCAILNMNYNSTFFNNEGWHERCVSLIKYLLTVLPSSCLEKKSDQGLTPLLIAAKKRKAAIVKLLISAGASQRARDKQERNIVHLLLEVFKIKPSELKEILDCFDKDAVQQMMLERCKVGPTALTPLALFLSLPNRSANTREQLGILEILTQYSDGEELEMLNGEGDLPLHVAVKNGLTSITEYLLKLRPHCLHSENATGRTPLEMAADIRLQDIVSGAPESENAAFDRNSRQYHRWNHSIIHKPTKDFLPVEERGLDELQSKKRTYEVCMAVDEELRREGKVGRRLVSLNEANEVARRLAGMKGQSRKVKVTGDAEGAGVIDEVEMWSR